MKTYPLFIGLLGAWSFGLMAPSLSDSKAAKKAEAKKTNQYERAAQNVQKTAPGKKAPKYKIVQR